jgi:hypothetical protein
MVDLIYVVFVVAAVVVDDEQEEVDVVGIEDHA